jgi:thiopeptide-type bacteriocin biosynthesis protein
MDPGAPAADPEVERQVLRQRLRALFSRREVREALETASPDLGRALDRWIAGEDAKAAARVELALSRYLARMAGRPTPFGLFAGWSVGTIGANTRLRLPERSAYRRHTRVDGAWLWAWYEDLRRTPEIRNELTYRPSEYLFAAGGQWRYPEPRRQGNRTTYFLVAVDDDEALRGTIERARGGSSRKDLAEALTDGDVARSEAEAYVDELIDAGILDSNLGPVLTGADPLEAAIRELERMPGAHELAGALAAIQAELRGLDQMPIGEAAPTRQRAVRDQLISVHSVEPGQSLIRMELHKPSPDLSLDRRLAEEVLDGVAILHRLFGQTPADGPLIRFREAFRDRFGEREIPLLQAIDEEFGIGLAPSTDPSPLLAPLYLSPKAARSEVEWQPEHGFLLAELSEMHRRGRREMALELEQLETLGRRGTSPLPDAFVAVVALSARDDESVGRGEFELVLRGIDGPSGARLFGRFCSLDPVLEQHVRGHLQSEERLAPEAIHAELVNLPAPNMVHVMARPVLREFELPLLARSGAPESRQLRLNDLYVSVSKDRVVLRSASHGREVRIHMSTAHNYGDRGMALYRFLGALQDQGGRGFGWNWGPLQSAVFLPRVRCGRIVLSLARWRLDRAMVRHFAGTEGGPLSDRIRKWREDWQVPRYVGLIEADQVLPVDLENALSVAAFMDIVRESSGATIREMFPGPEALCVRGPEGSFVHEIAIPFVRIQHAGRPPSRPPGGSSQRVSDRRFAPGSEWLYARLSVAESAADRLLLRLVAPLVAEVNRENWADGWFFIRYHDTECHLRLRLHGRPETLCERVLPALHAHARPLLEEGLLRKLQLDTYEPEWTRYGGTAGTRLAERLFHADSEASLAMVELTPGDRGAAGRWPLTLLSMDRLLADFGLDLHSKAELVGHLADTAARELDFGKRIKIRIGGLFRTHQRALTSLLWEKDPPAPLAAAFPILKRRSERIAAIACDQVQDGSRELMRDGAKDHVHLSVNRMVRSSTRMHEAVLYELLRRLYDSRVARSRSRAQPGS